MTFIKLKSFLNKSLLCVLLISGVTCKGQIKIPGNFTEIAPPKPFSKAWDSLGYSLNDFEVKITNGELHVNPIKAVQSNDFKIKSGLLRAINHGEFGGELIYIPDDHPKKPIKIKNGNAKFLFSLNNEIYFIEGLAHLGIDEGAMFKIDTASQPFSYKQIIDFGSSPEAFTVFKNSVFVVTNKYFFIVHDNKKELIFQDVFWNYLYPNSIAIFNDENIFVGMRGGFAKLDLMDKSIKFYKYNKK